jgi:uncharacterized membrane protein
MASSEFINMAAIVMEAAGVVTMLLGSVVAGVLTLRRSWVAGGAVLYPTCRQYLGRAILLGLEFLIAAA